MNCPHQSHKLSIQASNIRSRSTTSKTTTRSKSKAVPTSVIPKPKTTVAKAPKPQTKSSITPPSMIKKLKWSDFKGIVPKGVYWLAYTYWNYSYTHRVVKTSDPNKVKIQLEAKCSLGPKSWVRSPHDALLSHEQGHYDIACLCMLYFKKRVSEQEFNKLTYRDDMVKIYNDTVKEFRAKQIQYDEETRHYLDEEEQERWDNYIAEELKTMSVYEFMDITKY